MRPERWRVALLAEGVDRNDANVIKAGYAIVALLAEGVDRNLAAVSCSFRPFRSPSSRRAWIEISGKGYVNPIAYVALLAEGVDRNVA